MLKKTFGLVLSVFAIPWALAQDEVSALAAASAAKVRFESLLADPEMARLFALSPDLKRLQKQAEAKLALAQDTLTWARTRWDQRAAREHAISARLTYERLENQLRRRWEKAQILLAERDEKKRQQAETTSLRAEVLELAQEARRLLARPAPSDPQTLEARGAVGRALTAFENLPSGASADTLRSVRDSLLQSTRTLHRLFASQPEPDSHPAPEKLQRAVAAFLSGDYQRTAELLAVCELGSPEATRIAYLLRGAAYFSLWVESGEKDQTLYDRALADVRQCQSLGGTGSTTTLSPRFLALFR